MVRLRRFAICHPSGENRNDRIRQRIETALQDSFRACEVCGQPGELREDDWIKTLCDEHANVPTNTGEVIWGEPLQQLQKASPEGRLAEVRRFCKARRRP